MYAMKISFRILTIGQVTDVLRDGGLVDIGIDYTCVIVI